MADLLEEIEQRALSLGAKHRARLSQTLLESLHSPDSEVQSVWGQEVADRLAAYERDEI